jgi:hypothetical protein
MTPIPSGRGAVPRRYQGPPSCTPPAGASARSASRLTHLPAPHCSAPRPRARLSATCAWWALTAEKPNAIGRTVTQAVTGCQIFRGHPAATDDEKMDARRSCGRLIHSGPAPTKSFAHAPEAHSKSTSRWPLRWNRHETKPEPTAGKVRGRCISS